MRRESLSRATSKQNDALHATPPPQPPSLSVFIKSSRAGTAAAKRIDFLSALENGGRQNRRAIVGISVHWQIGKYDGGKCVKMALPQCGVIRTSKGESKCRRCRVVSWPALLISRRDLLRLPSQSQPPPPPGPPRLSE